MAKAPKTLPRGATPAPAPPRAPLMPRTGGHTTNTGNGKPGV
jgi:hypothetical protein